jgi:hypothetical protein
MFVWATTLRPTGRMSLATASKSPEAHVSWARCFGVQAELLCGDLGPAAGVVDGAEDDRREVTEVQGLAERLGDELAVDLGDERPALTLQGLPLRPGEALEVFDARVDDDERVVDHREVGDGLAVLGEGVDVVGELLDLEA